MLRNKEENKQLKIQSIAEYLYKENLTRHFVYKLAMTFVIDNFNAKGSLEYYFHNKFISRFDLY